MKEYESLTKFWKDYDFDNKGIHKDDKCEYLLNNSIYASSYNDYMLKYKNDENYYKNHFHSGLLPCPYGGNLINSPYARTRF